MFDQRTATDAADRDYAAIIDQLERLDPDDWQRQVRCDGWTVHDLARHVVSASRGQADGLRRVGSESAGGAGGLATLNAPAEETPAELLEAMRAGRAELLGALTGLPPDAIAALVPLPFGQLPTPVALQIVALEYGFHINDLRWALDQIEPLHPDIAMTLLEIAPGLLPMLAAGTPVGAPGIVPDRPVDYLLRTANWSLQAGYRDGWTIAPGSGGDEPGPSTTVITGDESSVALFIMGRLGADHPSLTVTDLASARMFKRYFPGP